MSFEIPTGLTELLQGFTVAVLRGRPADLYQFAAEYFHEAAKERRLTSHSVNSTGKKGVSFGGGGGESDGGRQEGLINQSDNCRGESEEEEDDEEFIGKLQFLK